MINKKNNVYNIILFILLIIIFMVLSLGTIYAIKLLYEATKFFLTKEIYLSMILLIHCQIIVVIAVIIYKYKIQKPILYGLFIMAVLAMVFLYFVNMSQLLGYNNISIFMVYPIKTILVLILLISEFFMCYMFGILMMGSNGHKRITISISFAIFSVISSFFILPEIFNFLDFAENLINNYPLLGEDFLPVGVDSINIMFIKSILFIIFFITILICLIFVYIKSKEQHE